jgi:hypothetical protein
MSTTLTALDAGDGTERCAICGCTLPDRSPTSPAIRSCELHWWREQTRRFDAGETVHPLALSVLTTGQRPHATDPNR